MNKMKDDLSNELAAIDVSVLEKMMEEMAAAPREEFGKRQPGERCMYEQFSNENKRKPNEQT